MNTNNSNYIGLADCDYDREENTSSWDNQIIEYLKTFRELHPIHPTENLAVHLTEGYYMYVQHYCTTGFFCTLKHGRHGRIILSKIYNI